MPSNKVETIDLTSLPTLSNIEQAINDKITLEEAGGWIMIESEIRHQSIAGVVTAYWIGHFQASPVITIGQQALETSVTGSTPQQCGAIYLRAGTLTTLDVLMGSTDVADEVTFRLVRQTNGSLIETIQRTGALGVAASAGDVVIPADDWYLMDIACDDPAGVSYIRGVRWLY